MILLQEDRRTYYYDEGRKKKNKIIIKIKQFGIIRMIASIHFLNSWILYIHYNTSIIINITTINHTNNNNIVNYISYSIHFYFITIRNNPINPTSTATVHGPVSADRGAGYTPGSGAHEGGARRASKKSPRRHRTGAKGRGTPRRHTVPTD